ncbi:hypothetical protein V9T40_012996 [Parthenolecanium corni]|uniref:Amino acid transporter transmembrane domain-containing protein n=1 Tax=Parthenolecanium corni TaxID=536013 RepID=A0AAN9T8R1_9HEMI
MSNYENFDETPKTQKKSVLEDVSSRCCEKDYKTFDDGFLKFENNTIEFIYCIEKNHSLEKNPAMAKSYNLQTQITTKYGTSFWTSVLRLLLLTSATPIFMIPSVLISAGYLTGSVLLLVVVCFYLHNMHMVVWSAEKISKLNSDVDVVYSDLLYGALKLERAWVGPWLGSFIRVMSTFIICLTWYSVCIFVYLFAAENVQTICNKWFYCELTIENTLLILLLPALVLSFISRAEYLESFAAFGFLCNLISLILVACCVLLDPSPWMLADADGSLKKPLFIGILLINLSVTPAVLLFKNETKNTRKFNSAGGVLNISYVGIFIIYLTFSLLYGLKYGNDLPINSIILLPDNNIITQVCPIFYGLGLICVYPHLYCGLLDLIARDIFQDKLEYKSRQLTFSTNIFKLFGVLICCLVTYLRPSLLLYLSLGGTICTSIDSIIYPALVHTIVYWKVSKSKLAFALVVIKNLIILAIGVNLVVVGVEDCMWFVNNSGVLLV